MRQSINLLQVARSLPRSMQREPRLFVPSALQFPPLVPITPHATQTADANVFNARSFAAHHWQEQWVPQQPMAFVDEEGAKYRAERAARRTAKTSVNFGAQREEATLDDYHQRHYMQQPHDPMAMYDAWLEHSRFMETISRQQATGMAHMPPLFVNESTLSSSSNSAHHHHRRLSARARRTRTAR